MGDTGIKVNIQKQISKKKYKQKLLSGNFSSVALANIRPPMEEGILITCIVTNTCDQQLQRKKYISMVFLNMTVLSKR